MARRRYRRRRFGRRRSRRYGRRRMRRGGRRETATTSQWGRPFTTRLTRGRRGTRSSYHRSLYNTTKFKAHYRSTEETSLIVTTPATVEAAAVHIQRALFTSGARGGGNAFWTAAGGALPIDAGVVVPPFDANIIIRGGIARCEVYNGAVESVRVDIFSVWTNAHPLDEFATDFTVSSEWDPTLQPDFQRFGKVINRKTMFLEPKGSILVTHRFKTQKLDTPQFIGLDGITSDTPSGKTLFWFIKVLPCAVLATPVIVKTSWNISFCGDALAS